MQSTYASQQPAFRGGGGGPSDSAEMTALMSAFTSPPDAPTKLLYAAMVDGLVADGVWAELDGLIIGAAHDSQASRVNFKNPSFVATAVNSPTHVAFRGWTGDGATSYLNTNWASLTHGVNYTQNDCHLGVYIGNNINSSTQTDVGTSAISNLIGCTSGSSRGRMQSASASTGMTLPANTSVGHLMFCRTGAATSEVFKNGGSISSPVTASAGLQSVPFFMCGAAATGPALAAPSTRQIVVFHWGGNLSAGLRTALRTRINTYLAAVGATYA